MYIAANACLLGSENCADYPEKEIKHAITENLARHRNASLIFAEECENVSISGSGKIDCNGKKFVKLRKGDWNGWHYERINAPTPPRVVFFMGCKNIRVSGITMVNQPSGWSYFMHDCENVVFDGITIDAEVQYPNNDGIHINSCRGVMICNCNISCGDDCLVVRANNKSLKENKVCEGVVVTNCVLRSWSAAVRIGWAEDGVIRNCTFSNLSIRDTSVGIACMIPSRTDCPTGDFGREETLVQNLMFSNIVMHEIYGRPVLLRIVPYNERIKEISNISFNNIIAKGLEYPLIMGKKNCLIHDIDFNNCSFTRCADSELEVNYEFHGAAAWDRFINENRNSNCFNIRYNNCIQK